MARRRSTQSTSSLDLFLDTICNAFGGIMFISILISILVQMRGEQEHDPSPAKTISHAEARLMEDEYEQLQRARETLRQEIASQEKLLVGDSKEEILDLSNRVEEVQQSIDKAIEKQSELVKRTVSLDTDIVSERGSIANLSKELQVARLAVAERGKEIDDALDSKEQSTTLPHRSPKQFVFRCLHASYRFSEVARDFVRIPEKDGRLDDAGRRFFAVQVSDARDLTNKYLCFRCGMGGFLCGVF